MDSLDILERAYGRPSVISDESKLSIDYLPENLPFREQDLIALSNYFSSALDGHLSSNRVIITGSVGVGKTSVAKKFGQWIEYKSQQLQRNVRYVHVNCRRAKTPFMILLSIVKELQGKVSNRGYAADELLDMVITILEEQRSTLILVLDEVEYIIPKGGVDLLYAFTRTADDKQTYSHNIGLILIARSSNFLSYLDQSTISSLSAPIIEISPYCSDELSIIIKDRVRECFVPGSVTEDSIQLIADIAEKRGGDARHAIELLYIAGKRANIEGDSLVYPEHVRSAKANVDPSLLKDVITGLHPHKLMLLLAISRLLRRTKKAYITTGIAEKEYALIAEEFGEEPRKHTQFWEYLQELEIIGVINMERSSKGQRGNTKYISILDLSLHDLEKEVVPRLQKLLN